MKQGNPVKRALKWFLRSSIYGHNSICGLPSVLGNPNLDRHASDFPIKNANDQTKCAAIDSGSCYVLWKGMLKASVLYSFQRVLCFQWN